MSEKLQERHLFSSEKKSLERVHYPFAWLPSKYTSVAPIGLLYSARFLNYYALFAEVSVRGDKVDVVEGPTINNRLNNNQQQQQALSSKSLTDSTSSMHRKIVAK